MVTRYIMELARLIYESQYFIRVSFECPPASRKLAFLGDEDAQRRNISPLSASDAAARPFRAARFMVFARCAVSRKSVNDNQIQPGQQNSTYIAARARLDRQESIKRRADETCVHR